MSPKKKPTKPIAIYVRVSRVNGRDVTAEGMTAHDQEKRCRAQLEALGLEAGKVYVDLDQSGGKESRPQFDLMKDSIENGSHGGVIVWKLSRFGRRVQHVLKDVKWIETHGAAFICVDPGIDTSSPTGRFTLTVFAALDELELEERTAGWARTRQASIERGLFLGGTVPLGYDRVDSKLVPNDWAPVVREIFEKRARGISVTELAEHLREIGAPSDVKTGTNVWSTTGVRRLLLNRTYLGETRSGEFVCEDAHEAIVPLATWLAAQKVQLNGGGTKRSRGESAPALLAGIVRCATCGSTMSRDSSTRRDGTKYETYRCRGQGGCDSRPVISVAQLDEHVLDVVGRYAQLGFQDGRADRDARVIELEREIADAKAAKEQYAATFLEQGLDAATVATALQQFDAKVRELETELAGLAVDQPAIEEIPAELFADDGTLILERQTARDWIESVLERDPAQANRIMRKLFPVIRVRPGREPVGVRAVIEVPSEPAK